MSALSARTAPTAENVRKLSARLAGDLRSLFRRSAIDTRREIGIDMDLRSRQISIKGDRPDAQTIAALIESQPDIARQIHDIAALSRQVVVSERGADSRLQNRLAHGAAQVSAVIADYATRFNGKDESQDFAPISHGRSGDVTQNERVIARYDAVSGASGAATNFSVIFDGADVQVHANAKPWISTRS